MSAEKVIKQINIWKNEASSFRNDGWVTNHYKCLIEEVYNVTKDALNYLNNEATLAEGDSIAPDSLEEKYGIIET